KMDYIGSLCGALVWVFVLPAWFIMTEMAFVLGVFNVAVAGIALYYFRRLVAAKTAIGLFWLTGFLLLVGGLLQAGAWTSVAEQYLYRDKVVFSHTSDYQHIVVTESRAGDVSCYINGQLQFNSFDEYIYHEQLVHPAFVLAPVRKRVLVLGGGDGLAVREILKYSGVESITLCDLDPVMTELARENDYFAEMNRNSLQDARLVVIDNHALVPSGTEPILVRSQKNP
ncbi:MAG: spermidine synthase, partial [Deltaproteobacteria bacterium]|nr:spermidine synthase [Deltaproteobacteria bacterium]